ncbi:hypothetical protein NHQ30_000487 [Ciborinia camelliae]|nr:hypothetical protein NHQ30_000487 [Ciborinia camelliae]
MTSVHELQPVGGAPDKPSSDIHVTQAREFQDQDVIELARAGKKQRRFALVSMIGFACSLMGTWEGVLVVFLLGYQNGGPAGLIYGFLVIWFGTFCTFVTMSELASMIPTAGGQYHYVAILAPTSSKKFLSYVTATTAGAFFTSELIEGLAIQNNSEYVPTGWKGTLIFWAVLFLCVAINGFLSRALPILEVAILIIHILGFFAIIIPLVHLGPHGNAKEIFTTFVNTGWESQSLSFFIGLNGNIAAFTGADSAIHMSEEVKHASLNVPRSMLLSVFMNGLLGFGMLLAVLFCAGDLDKAAESPTGFPFIAIFTNAVGSSKGANTMVSIVVLMSLAGAIAALASASRMMWSFARDRGLPWASRLSSVHSKTAIPLIAIFVVTVCSALIGIINIGSSDAFNAVVSLVVEAFATSYLVPCSLLLYRRLKGQILEPKGSFDVTSTDKQLKWGKWRAKGWLGTASNAITCVYLSIVCFFAFWPAVKPVTAVNMNYSSLVLGTVVIASLTYYLLWAKKIYQGPIMEVSVHVL